MRTGSWGIGWPLALIAVSSPLLSGCATVGMHIRYGQLASKTEMSEAIFLELDQDRAPTVFVSEGASRGLDIEVSEALVFDLQAAGYTVVDNPEEASLLLQLHHLQVVETELGRDESIEDAIEAAWSAGSTAALAGTVLGAENAAAEIGLAVGIVSFILDARTKYLAHTLTTDIRLTERVPGPNGAEPREHTTRVVSAASKVGLTRADALPALIAGLVRSAAGVFPVRRVSSRPARG